MEITCIGYSIVFTQHLIESFCKLITEAIFTSDGQKTTFPLTHRSQKQSSMIPAPKGSFLLHQHEVQATPSASLNRRDAEKPTSQSYPELSGNAKAPWCFSAKSMSSSKAELTWLFKGFLGICSRLCGNRAGNWAELPPTCYAAGPGYWSPPHRCLLVCFSVIWWSHLEALILHLLGTSSSQAHIYSDLRCISVPSMITKNYYEKTGIIVQAHSALLILCC